MIGPGRAGDAADEAAARLRWSGYAVVAADACRSVATPDGDGLRAVEEGRATLLAQSWSDDQIGVLGVGPGGRVALLAAVTWTLGAAVSVSPPGLVTALSDSTPALLDRLPALRTPWLALFAAYDPLAGRRDAAAVAARLRRDRSPVYADVVAYPRAGADFAWAGGPGYVHDAAFDTAERIVEWFDRRLVPRPTLLAREWAERAERVPSPETDHCRPAGRQGR